MTSDVNSIGASTPFRVLSLDGGGAKGVYTLGVLREVEAIVGRPLCEVFDVIFGTSTGAIIAALLGLGYKIDQIEKLYLELVPAIMSKKTAKGRSAELRAQAARVFGTQDFTAFKTKIGIVATNYEFQRPMVFKASIEQAHGRKETFDPGFGATIAEAVVASAAAFPFFEVATVSTKNRGQHTVMDGGFVANNPTLFALADAREALGQNDGNVAVLSVGVGTYLEPKKSLTHRLIFSWWPFRLINRMFNTSSNTIEQLRFLLFADVPCVRVNEAYPDEKYATDLLEADPEKLKILHTLGGESFAKHEDAIRRTLKLPPRRVSTEAST